MAEELFLRLLFFFLLIAGPIRDPEFHEALQNLFLRNLGGFVARLFEHGRAAALDLAGSQRRKNYKSIFAIDIVGNSNQAKPPNEAMISSTRACWRSGAAVPLCTIDSSRRTEFSKISLMMM